MSETNPNPDAPEGAVFAQAIARATEVLERIERRRMEILDRRREAIALTERLLKSEPLRKAAARLEPRLNEIAKAAGERLGRTDAARKELAETVKKARLALTPRKKRRRAVSSG